MLRQNKMPPATTKWQALFGGVSLAQPFPPPPMPSPTGAEIALTVGAGIVGTAVGALISYGICCWAMKRCG